MTDFLRAKTEFVERDENSKRIADRDAYVSDVFLEDTASRDMSHWGR